MGDRHVVFGAGAIDGGAGGLKLLAAVSLLLTVGGPIVAGAALVMQLPEEYFTAQA